MGGLLAFGYNLTDNARAEIEAGYRQLNGDTTSVTVGGTTYTVNSSDVDSKAFSTMVNLYYSIPTGGDISPYIGVGGGWAHEQDGGANAFGYQAMAGLDFKVSDSGTLFAGYRYFGTTDFDNQYTVAGVGVVTESASIKAHAFDVGYRFSF